MPEFVHTGHDRPPSGSTISGLQLYITSYRFLSLSIIHKVGSSSVTTRVLFLGQPGCGLAVVASALYSPMSRETLIYQVEVMTMMCHSFAACCPSSWSCSPCCAELQLLVLLDVELPSLPGRPSTASGSLSYGRTMTSTALLWLTWLSQKSLHKGEEHLPRRQCEQPHDPMVG